VGVSVFASALEWWGGVCRCLVCRCFWCRRKWMSCRRKEEAEQEAQYGGNIYSGAWRRAACHNIAVTDNNSVE
jgi:hypothetical protein